MYSPKSNSGAPSMSECIFLQPVYLKKDDVFPSSKAIRRKSSAHRSMRHSPKADTAANTIDPARPNLSHAAIQSS